ncbi:OmpA family protein [Rhodobacterales bacterium HKCCE2091]|nr:OmpA family protein [Rhodobacterales bacterium HKCCE2091]
MKLHFATCLVAILIGGAAAAQTPAPGPADGETLDLMMSSEFEQMLAEQRSMMMSGGYTEQAGMQGMMVAPLVPVNQAPVANAVPDPGAGQEAAGEGALPITVQPPATEATGGQGAPVADPAEGRAVVQATPAPAEPAAAVPSTRGVFFNLSENMIFFRVQFSLNSADLMPEALPQLDQLCLALANNPEYDLNVFGHTDTSGPAEYNLDLSARRAAAVAGYMIGSCGLEPDRLQPVGLGEEATLPDIAPNDALNRRVEFQVIL